MLKFSVLVSPSLSRLQSLFTSLGPWALRNGRQSRCVLSVFYERRWEQSLEDLRRELNIEQPPVILSAAKKRSTWKRQNKMNDSGTTGHNTVNIGQTRNVLCCTVGFLYEKDVIHHETKKFVGWQTLACLFLHPECVFVRVESAHADSFWMVV